MSDHELATGKGRAPHARTLGAGLRRLALVACCLLPAAAGADPAGVRSPLGPLDGQAHAANPANGRVLRVVVFDPADEESPPDTRERLDRAMTAIQDWYRGEMERNGYGPRTFPLERDAEGHLIVHTVRSSNSYAEGERIREDEIRDRQVAPALRREGIDVDHEHVVIFAHTVFTHVEERGTVVRSSSVYGGLGDERSGTAWVTDCALLDPRNLGAKEPTVWDDGLRRYTLGGYNVVYLGGVAHELGHSFGLPHDVETDAQRAALGYALMGSGNYHLFGELAGEEKGAFLSYAEATMLAAHPLFRLEGDAQQSEPAGEPTVRWSEVAFESEKGQYVVRGRVDAEPRAYAVVAFHDDQAVEADYDATAWVGKVDAEGRFEVRVEDPSPGHYELRLRACLVSGAEREVAYRLTVGDDLELAGAVEPVKEEGGG